MAPIMEGLCGAGERKERFGPDAEMAKEHRTFPSSTLVGAGGDVGCYNYGNVEKSQ